MASLFPTSGQLGTFQSVVLGEIKKLVSNFHGGIKVETFEDFCKIFSLDVEIICRKIKQPAENILGAFDINKFYKSHLGKLALSGGSNFLLLFSGVNNTLFVLLPFNSYIQNMVDGSVLIINQQYMILRMKDYIKCLVPNNYEDSAGSN